MTEYVLVINSLYFMKSLNQKTRIIILISILIVVAGIIVLRTQQVSPTETPLVVNNQEEQSSVSLYSLIPCHEAVGITLDPQSGALVSNKVTKFAEYDIGIENGAQVPKIIADDLATVISRDLCDFEQSYNDTAFSPEDQKMLGFIGSDTDTARYSYTLATKQIPVAPWKVINYFSNQYMFTGGAHGMGNLHNIIYDTQEHTAVTGSDIFDQTKIDQIRDLVTKKLQEVLGDMADDMMIQDGVRDPASLFGVVMPTDTGLIVKFQSYAVAPYAAGQPEVSFTFDELDSLLNPTWKARLGR